MRPTDEEDRKADSDALDPVEETENGSPASAPESESIEAERDRYLELARRTQAEFENYQKRVRRDAETERRYAALPVVTDLLPVMDNLDRALEACSEQEKSSSLYQGIVLVRKQWLDVLQKHGVVALDPAGQPFDPNLHEAVMQQPSDEHPPMTVLRVLRGGYQLHDRVIRPAQVIVAAPPAT